MTMDLLMHILLPYTVLKSLFRLENRYLLPLLFFSVFQDFDRFLLMRKASESPAFVLLATAAIYMATRQRADGKKISFIAGFYMLSHLVMDLGSPMPLLWPLDNTFYTVNIYFQLQNLFPVLWWEVTTTLAVKQGVGTILWTSSFGLLALLAMVYAFRKKIRAAVK